MDSKGQPILNAKGTAPKVITTWHTEYDTVTRTVRGIERQSIVGKGTEVKTSKSPAKWDSGCYVNVDKLDEAEMHELKSVRNVKRIVNPRYVATIKTIRHLANSLKNGMVDLPENLKGKLLQGIATELQEVERILTNGKKEKAQIAGLV